MDSTKDRAFISSINTISCESAEQSVDAQINLPEYCGDIRKILKCFVIPNVFACSLSGDRAVCDGEALIRILYVSENEKIECFEQSAAFSKYITVSPFDGDVCVKANAETEYVNCRAVSQRRIAVSASVNIRFCVSQIKREPLFSACEDVRFETLSEKLSCSVPKAMCEKLFEMSESAALPQSLPPVRAIIHTSTCALIDAVKTVSDKMLIKGEMVTDILYCPDSESASPEKYRHSMPISQIIELEGIDDNSLCDVNVNVLSVCVTAKADSEGKNQLFDICVKACASVRAFENREVCAVSDGYSTEYETEAEYKNMLFLNHIFTYKETKQLRSEIDLSSLSASDVSGVFPLLCSGSVREKDSVLCGSSSALIGILYKTSQGEYGYTEKNIDFEFECQGGKSGNPVNAQPVFTVSEISSSMNSQSKAEIRMSVIVSMPIFEEICMNVCTKLEALEDRKKPQGECPLTVYFSSKGERIWDIARKYNTTCERIKLDNDITCDELGENKILLITSA